MKNLPELSRLLIRRIPRAVIFLLTLIFSLALLVLLIIGLSPSIHVKAAGTLAVEILAGYNLVVDSNVSSPSTYGPSAATVASRVCNTHPTDPVTNVVVYIGNAAAGTPGIYPSRGPGIGSFNTEHPALVDGGGTYAFTHAGGSLGLADATRQAGTLQPGQCIVQYWTFEYPRCENVGGAADLPPCNNDPVWGDSVKPEDDLWLNFDVWATGYGVSTATRTWTMHMRNEISAMANKIEPNGNPGGYWFNADTNNVQPGGVITTNGILYRIGNVRFGFDNDSDYLPDYNFWMQPIGDPGQFDPGCFRLIRTSGIITVEGSTSRVFTFTDQLYFTRPDVPEDNTNVIGEVYYTFLALGSNCAASPSPYQEAASGYDNEKFNADYGAGGPSGMNNEASQVIIDKSSNPDLVSVGQVITYYIPFQNNGTTAAGLILYQDAYVNNPLVISDTIPAGTVYITGSATYTLSTGSATIRYSTDNGQTWSNTEPVPASNVTTIQWWLDQPLPAGASGSATFAVEVPSTYSGGPVIENCANAQFDSGSSITEACDLVMVRGSAAIGNEVWRDEDSDGQRDAGEVYLNSIGVSLYLDKNGDGILDSNDMLVLTTTTGLTTTGFYTFSNLYTGTYLVQVDANDPDLPPGYRLTTVGIYPVYLTSTDVLTADFGFGPSLGLDKVCQNTYQGQEMSYNIVVQNRRPGGGEPAGPSACQYTVWATIDHPTKGLIPEGGGPANSQWSQTDNALGEPDNEYAFTAMSNNTDILGLSGLNTIAQLGHITKVEALLYVKEMAEMQSADQLQVSLYMTDTARGTKMFAGAYFTQTVGQLYTIITDVTSLNPGGPGAWQWSSFENNVTEMQLTANKGGGTTGDLALDAAAYIITTDQPCRSLDPSDIMTSIPLTDTYDTSRLEFVSANPPPSSINTTAGVITWTNLGPIYPGESRSVQVTFRALEPVTTTATVVNWAGVTSGLFSDGGLTGNKYDTASCLITATGTITGRVFSDVPTTGWVNPNGFDSSDYGIPGITVTLYACVWDNDLSTPIAPSDPDYDTVDRCDQQSKPGGISGVWQPMATLWTEQNGFYTFNGLLEGFYYVLVTPTVGITETAEANDNQSAGGFTCPGSGVNTCNNVWGDPFNDDLNTTNFNPLSPREVITNVNFGYTMPAMLFGTVWHDVDGDGVRDIGDGGLDNSTQGITVTLYNASTGAVVATTQTDANGDYQFTGLAAGTYTITVNTGTLPGSDWMQTAETGPNADGTLDSQMRTITLVAGQVSGSYDFGYHQTGTAAIGDTVYYDWDGDAQQDANEEGIPSITVYLYEDEDGDGVVDSDTDAVITTTTTSITGFYQFNGLPADDYVVVVDSGDSDFPLRYYPTQDPDEDNPLGTVCETCDNQGVVSDLPTGVFTDVIDFGYQPYGYGVIGDTVWRDMNGDGIQSGFLETGIVSITVWLEVDLNNDGVYARVMTTTTDADGHYLFEDLPDGNYRVVVDSSDSDLPDDPLGRNYMPTTITTTNAITITYANPSQRTYLDADFGFAPPGVIGDFIWQDNDGDGDQDAGEPGIAGVEVQLYRGGIGGTLVATTTTDASGLYEFTNLISDTYTVVVVTSTLPSGYVQTGDPDGNGRCMDGGDAYDDCNSYTTFRLRTGRVDRTRDFGYLPPRAIGDFVWLDSDADGVQDAGESGISGVTIELAIPGDGTVTTTTDIEGYYGFGSNVLTTTGVYTVSVITSSLPITMSPTYDKDGLVTPHRTLVDITTTTFITDVDFGYRYAGAYRITGTVFYDVGGSTDTLTDTFTSGDTPYAGITVYLYDSTGGAPVAVTTTDSAGHFAFTDLYDGHTYTVSVNINSPTLANHTLTASPDGMHYYHAVTISGADVGDQDFGFFIPRPVLDLIKSVDPAGSISAGDMLAYTITVSNTGSLTATGVIVTDVVPLNTTFITATTPHTGPSGGVITWSLGSLLTQTNQVVTMVVQVNSGVISGTILTNTAWVTSSEGITDTDTVTNVVVATDLAVTKSDSPDPVVAGSVLTYTLVYTNNGPAAAQNVYLTDTLPLSVTYGGIVSQPTGWSNPPTYIAGPPATLTWYTPTLAAGASGNIVFTVTVGSGVSGTITNTVVITTTTPDSNLTNNDDDEPTTVQQADVTVVKSDNPDPVVAGQVLTYTLVFTNNGPAVAQPVTVTEQLPADVTYGGDVSLPGGMNRVSTSPPTWVTPTLAAGQGGTIVFTVTVGSNVSGTITNTVAITTTTPDSNPNNNDDDEPTTVQQATATIGNYVWNDTNADGNQGAGESGLSDITVTLYTSGGTFVAQTTTDASGYYTFTNVVSGTYYISFTAPVGYVFSPQDAVVDTLDSDANASGQTADFSVNAGETNMTIDAGLYQPATVYGRLYIDTNGDGNQDVGEPDLANVDVIITDSSGVTQTVSTDANGDWTATVPPGSTTADVDESDPDYPAGYTQTEGTDPTTVMAVAGASTDAGNDGYYLPGDVYGHLYIDTNGDGNQDVGEPDLANVDVIVTDSSGVTQTVSTDVNGDWTATVPPGSTTADVDESDPDYPAGYTQTEGTDPTTVTAVAGASTDAGNDGYQPLATIGNYVWNDANADGIQGAGESGLSGITVTLYTSGGTFVAQTTTNASGYYTFTNVVSGTYYISFTAPVGYVFSPQDAVVDTLDSDANASGQTADFSVNAGETNMTIDAGLYQPATVYGHLYIDTNGDGNQDVGEPDLANVDVIVTDSSGVTQTVSTDVNGDWTATVPPGSTTADVDESDPDYPAGYTQTEGTDPTTVIAVAGASTDAGNDGYQPLATIGDYVWNDANADGIQGAGESGLSGITVTLYTGGGAFVAQTTTDASGYYTFTNVVSGTYYISFTAPVGYVFSPQDAVVDTLDSDANASGQTATFSVNAGDVNTTIDAGLYQPADVTVVKSDNPDPVVAGGVLTYTLVFSNNGPAVAQPVTVTEQLPAGVTYGGDVSLPAGMNRVSTAPPTWVTPTLGAGQSGTIVFTVTVGSGVSGTITNSVAITTTTPDSNPNNNDDDEPTVVTTVQLATIGDYVWNDADAEGDQDETAAGIAGVRVYLDLNGNGAYDGGEPNDLTDASGLYSITVAAGTYTVTVDTTTLPAGYVGTTPDPLVLTVAAGATNNTGDFGFAGSPDIEIDKQVTPGEAVHQMPFTYTIYITNTGQVRLDPVRLTDTLPADFYYVVGSGSPSDPDVIAEPLLGWFDLGLLDPGDGFAVTFAVTATPGITGTYINVATTTGTAPSGVVTDTDDAPVAITDPAVVVEKQVASVDMDDVAPNFVTFTIAITNIGPSVIDELPLLDQYDTTYLSFVDATPYPEEDANDGLLTWSDLTGPAPNGFNRNLPPGEAFIVTTVFSVVRDITTTVNTAVVTDALDVYVNSANESQDDAVINNVPTAVTLLYFRMGGVAERQVRLEWATAVEVDNYGFNLYRAAVADRSQSSLVAFIPAQAYGGGTTYIYDDSVPSDGVWWYWLADVDTSGQETFHGPVNTRVGAAKGSNQIYLPLIMR